MAAVLCKPIASCFEFICTAPCKLCTGGCNLCSDGLVGLCTNPLSAFVVVTFLVQIPLAVAAALEIGGIGNCKGSQWLVGMLAVAIAHMITSVYMAARVANRTDEALRDRHTAWERISYLLCHDPWIAFYLLIVIFYVVWLFVGAIWSLNGSFDEGDCDLNGRVSIVMGLGWFYLFAGPSVLSCNMCCACCDKGDYAGDDAAFAAKEAAKEAKKQQQRQGSSAATNSNNNSNNNYQHSADIESPNPPPQEAMAMPQSKQKSAPSPPRTYSVDGIPIPDDGKASVMEAKVVIEGDALPPPMAPPKDGFNAQLTKVKAEEVAAKASATAEKAAKSVGGWFNKKKKGGEAPERKATLY